ncbi:MAG TPA: glycosyltransferase family 1 protein [Candidatus Sulfotelmatobacter sp.]|jgi:glycosyltransferase involved in cell wall biosynthesis|nr:glycosyltransferase family 1 protein [Candidatus Sulfotelmatobacter sp.]
MIIGIDGNEANVQKRVGISEYAYQLLDQFSKLQVETQNIKFVIYLKNKPLSSLPKASEQWQYRVLKPGKLWTQWRLPLDLFFHKPRPDIFFSMTHYAPRFSSVPTVVSVMDVSYLRFPELFQPSDLYQLRNWTIYSVKRAKKVLTISNSSRDDIIKAYKTPADKVVTIYPGIKTILSLEPHVFGMNQLQTKYHISNKFILFVGTLQPRKNIVRLIEAFSRLKTEDNEIDISDLQLVIIGRRGWQYEEILAAPRKFGVEGHVKFLENVQDDELDVFYQHALCYVLPSLYEGFGLPVVEAMQRGCPVITSNVSSLPEVGGDAVLYVDPEDVTDIEEKIKQLISDKKLREELIEKGKKQIQKFSWEKSAKETLAILKSVTGKE